MLPEVAAVHHADSLVRIPPSDDVPISDRVRRILDTAPMRRLASISQLGLVSLVYPGATHSRLEHSLGVYHNALRLLERFAVDDRFVSHVNSRCGEAFLLAALLHDIGHWPFCHPIEDMQLEDIGEHESRIEACMADTDLADCIREDWQCDQQDVLALLGFAAPPRQAMPLAEQFLSSCLSGPVDIDKLDYLQRDSIHAGVPYGRNFDVSRLIRSMCWNPETNQLAIGDKGRTAAEMMVFARYVMFSEVYWHHAVRSATAMLQRTVFLLQHRLDLKASLRLDDATWIAVLRRAAAGSVAEPLAEGLFGSRRRLYKRAAEFNLLDGQRVHAGLARRPYPWLVHCAQQLAGQVTRRTGISVQAADLLIDAPPVKLEVDINMDVVARDGRARTLGEVSPVASALAREQFDNHVKRVRIFVREDLREPLCSRLDVAAWGDELIEASQSLEKESV